MKIYLQRTADGFCIPESNVYEADEQYKQMQKLKIGDIYEVNVKRPRNLLHHRKLMAIIEYMVAIGTVANKQRGIELMKIIAGHFVSYEHDGHKVIVFGSIAFDNMQQSEFEQFYNDCLLGAVNLGYLPKDFDDNVITRGMK
jgi:hypothetical protein